MKTAKLTAKIEASRAETTLFAIVLILFFSLFVISIITVATYQTLLKNLIATQATIDRNNYLREEADANSQIAVNLTDLAETYEIEKAGTYVLTGETEYSVIISDSKLTADDEVTLRLDAITIETTDQPTIINYSDARLIIELIDASQNSLVTRTTKKTTSAIATLSSAAEIDFYGESGTLIIEDYGEGGGIDAPEYDLDGALVAIFAITKIAEPVGENYVYFKNSIQKSGFFSIFSDATDVPLIVFGSTENFSDLLFNSDKISTAENYTIKYSAFTED